MSKENVKEKDVFLTVKDVSKKIGLSPSVIYTVLNYEKIPHMKIGGRIVIKENDLKEWEGRNISSSRVMKQEGGKKKK